MRVVDNAKIDEQREHMEKCKLCRMWRSKIDLHANAGWSSELCLDLALEILLKAFKSRNTAYPLFNGAPFVNKNCQIDRFGGGFLEPGKSSHSTTRVPGTTKCQFKHSAGENAAKYFLLLKLCSTCDAGKGTIFLEFKKFRPYSAKILISLRRFENNNKALSFFNKAVQRLRVYCRKAPHNIVDSEKPGPCAFTLYTSIYNNSTIDFCKNCTNDNCTVKSDVLFITESVVQLLSCIENNNEIKLTDFFPTSLIDQFKMTKCQLDQNKFVLISNPSFELTQSLFN